MRNMALGLATATLTLMAGYAFADGMPTRYGPAPCCASSWTGFYVGINAGGTWDDDASVHSSGAVSFVNPAFTAGAGAVADGIARMSTRSIDLSSASFLGGVQAGYNYQMGTIVTGIETDIQWLGNSNDNRSVPAFTALNGFPESYSGTVTASRDLDYIGTLRARLGLLVNRDTLVYLTGGMAYGDASLKYSVRAQESLGPGVYVPLVASNSAASTLVGGTIGAGSEVRMTSNTSIKGEYLFYDLGSLTARGPWTQNCVPGVCADPAAGAWGAATVHSKGNFEGQLFRVGLNFKFGDDRGMEPLK